MEERRRTEHQRGSGDGNLGAAIRTEDGVLYAAQIVGIHNDRVSLAFSVGDLPRVDPGDEIRLLFRAIHGGEMTAAGRLLARPEQVEDKVHFSFAFGPGLAGRPSPPSLTAPEEGEDLNRRDCFRIKPDRRSVPVIMRPYGDAKKSILRQLTDLRLNGADKTLKGWVFDISVEGIGVMLEEAPNPTFGVGDHLDLSFTLPKQNDPLMVGCWVRHCFDVPIGTRFGLQFDEGSTAHHRWVQSEVHRFVMDLQQRVLRSRAR